MRRFEIAGLLVIGMIAGCMASAPPPGADVASSPSEGTPPRPASYGTLVLDRADVALGTTVEFHHMPGSSELHDAAEEFALRHVVVTLQAWPQGNLELPRFDGLPLGSDAIVVLPGYPPDRAALAAWNYAAGPVRLILVVDGPPDNPGIFDDLNLSRHLERVVARMDQPSRAGFERLQRPLSFVRALD